VPRYGEESEHKEKEHLHSFREVTEGLPFIVTTWGGAISDARFLSDSRPHRDEIQLDWHETPTLAIQGIPGLSKNVDYAVHVDETNRTITAETHSPDGLHLTRTFASKPKNLIHVTDVLNNTSDTPQTIPEYGLQLGAIGREGRSFRDSHVIRVHTQSAKLGQKPQHLGTEILRLFRVHGRMPPDAIAQRIDERSSWIAIENGSVYHVLQSEEGFQGIEIRAHRAQYAPTLRIESVSGLALFGDFVLEPSQSVTNRSVFFLGNKSDCPVRLYTPGEKVRFVLTWLGLSYVFNLPLAAILAASILFVRRRRVVRKGKFFLKLLFLYPILFMLTNAAVHLLFKYGGLPDLAGLLPVPLSTPIAFIMCLIVGVFAARKIARRHAADREKTIPKPNVE